MDYGLQTFCLQDCVDRNADYGSEEAPYRNDVVRVHDRRDDVRDKNGCPQEPHTADARKEGWQNGGSEIEYTSIIAQRPRVILVVGDVGTIQPGSYVIHCQAPSQVN